MSQMLRHKPTGVLYIATPQLLKRTDMEVVDDAPLVVGEAEPQVAEKPARKSPAKKPAIVQEASTEDGSEQEQASEPAEKPANPVGDLFNS